MPHPSWSLMIASLGFAFGCLFMGGVALSGFVHWDPCAWVVAVLLGGPLVALGCGHYVATFHAHEPCAKLFRCLLPMMAAGGFLMAGLLQALSLIYGIARGMLYAPLAFALLGTALAWAGWLTYRWHERLAHEPILAELVEQDGGAPVADKKIRFSLRDALALVSAFSVVFGGILFGYRDIPPQIVMHASPEEARLTLPAGAADVCIWRGSRGTIAYDFAIDETGFFEWAASVEGSIESEASGVTLRPIAGSFDIHTSSPPYQHTIHRGWFYDFHIEDRAHQYAYDADLGRAYYVFHAH